MKEINIQNVHIAAENAMVQHMVDIRSIGLHNNYSSPNYHLQLSCSPTAAGEVKLCRYVMVMKPFFAWNLPLLKRAKLTDRKFQCTIWGA